MFFIFLGAIISFILWVIITYNSLISLRNNVQNAWKQIDVQLKRRHDLIPNLVSAVKGAMEFEQDTLEKVISARTKAVSSSSTHEKAGSENMLTQSLGKLFAVMESYPDLKSNAQVMSLQEELTSTENKISFSRQLYNDLVASYRTRQEIFPNNIITALFSGFQKEEYFEAPPAERKVPAADISIRKAQSC
ncbi:MAG: LemA family protein [Nitrospiraceae bacterium]|nr:MAG: LemA family protein [Nitrospiraceae bacterium]